MPVDPVDTDPASAPTFAVLEDQLSVAVWTDDHRRAEEVIAEARRRVEWRRSSTAVHNIVQQEFDLRARQGRLEEAAQVAEQAWMLALDEESMIGRASDLVILATLRGDHETVERHLAVLARIVASGSPTLDASPIVRAQRLHAVGVADLAGGRVAAAIEHLSAAVAAFDEAGVLEVGAMPIAARLAEALVSGDRLDEAERLADELAVRAERSGRVRSRAEAARALADVRAARGDLDGAAALAAEALAGFDALGMPVERVRTQLLVAAVARRRRRRGEARVALEDARAIAVRCGALGVLPRIDAELDRLGERVGDGELTRTERQVVELVARGRSNAEIAAELHLSVRTVESNLTRVYRKLGVRSRAELIAGRSRQ
jgi:DNA-binding CsgD family transcriptional regulator